MRLQSLTAPVAGVVQDLAVHTLGGVVTPAQQLLRIVPADGGVEVAAVIANQDVGFVEIGQEAEIKIDTFPFTRYGLIHGRVGTQEPMVRRLFPGGGQIRTAGPGKKDQPFPPSVRSSHYAGPKGSRSRHLI